MLKHRFCVKIIFIYISVIHVVFFMNGNQDYVKQLKENSTDFIHQSLFASVGEYYGIHGEKLCKALEGAVQSLINIC